eukprot:CAMPEP_0113899194 /NCGR_PEP_ID=MMETSP0780_2-20120614/19861_1 /TAXON_ID=652834 /ORGANISM="Palpitomonas bilix" /LENGTH=241 /DNA_ID=CAMNT_0000891265 /DNA_START=150 /DNA_END=875 /DNA_ORIENTATION=- /assembly_acc=CAM_ASM_000599
MAVKVYLDIDVGNQAEYAEKREKFDRASSFISQQGRNFGLGSDIEALTDEQRETAADLYSSDPAWADKGEALFVQPPSLRVGRLVFELYSDKVPKTAENFKCLCSGEKGKGKDSGKPLHFKGSKIHRAVKGFMCQGGDFVRHDGSAGESIYGKKFNDEKPGLKIKHDVRGLLSMANSGKNSNSSQFFITFAAAPHLDGKHVVFGRMVEGEEALAKMEEVAGEKGGKEVPSSDITIADCGVL